MKNKYKVYLASFLLPILAITIIFVFNRFHPFGDRSIFVVDLFDQYLAFFYYFYDTIHQGNFSFFSWQSALGMNHIGLFSYYLSSPFNIFLLFFNRDLLADAIMWLTIIKIGFIGLSMAFYLRQLRTKAPNIFIMLFSFCYAMMSYVICYSQNIMWLDALIYLPLILSGVEKIVNRRFSFLYVITLALMFIASFYISYMVGIFVFIYFIIQLVLKNSNWRNALQAAAIFIGSTLLSLGTSLILLIPTLIHSQVIYKNTEHFIPNVQAILPVFLKLFNGIYETLKTSHSDAYYANIFSGILVLLLFVIFFLSNKIKLREKICFAIVAAIFMLSFSVGLLNLIWHAFTPPTWFPFRFSFLFSFTIILMAFQLMPKLDKNDRKWVLTAFAVCMLFLVVSFLVHPELMRIKIFAGNIILLFLFAGLLYLFLSFPAKRKLILSLTVVLVFIDMTSNGLLLTSRMNKEFFYKDYAAVTLNQAAITAIEEIKNEDNSFYRMRLDFTPYENSGYLYQANTISHNSSMLNKQLSQTMRQFGYGTQPEYRKIIPLGGTELSDSILDIKYTIGSYSHGPLPTDKAITTTDVRVNTNALPLGFFVNPSAAENISTAIDTKRNQTDMLARQQDLARLIGDNNNEIVQQIEPLKIEKQSGKTVHKNKNVTYYDTTYYLPETAVDQKLYYFFATDEYVASDIFLNDKYAYSYPSKGKNDGIAGIPEQNEKVTKITCRVYGKPAIYPVQQFFTINTSNLAKYVKPAQTTGLKNIVVNNSSLSGTVDSDKAGIMLLTIPYDKGWTFKINGQPITSTKAAGSFTAIEVPAGHSVITAEYQVPGLRIGSIGTLTSIALLIFLFSRRQQKIPIL